MEENSAERVPVTIPDAVQLLERRLHRLAAEGLLSDTEAPGARHQARGSRDDP
jgi:hypothetical protein